MGRKKTALDMYHTANLPYIYPVLFFCSQTITSNCKKYMQDRQNKPEKMEDIMTSSYVYEVIFFLKEKKGLEKKKKEREGLSVAS